MYRLQLDQSNYIEYDRAGQATCFVGPIATKVFQAQALRGALGLWAIGQEAGRTPHSKVLDSLLRTAATITGRVYPNRKFLEAARRDLQHWVDETIEAAKAQASQESVNAQ